MNVLVTGATGFVGRHLCSRLLAEGWQVRGTLLATEEPSTLVAGVEPVVVAPLGPQTSWSKALEEIDVIIHLAARVHVMDDPSKDPLSEFRLINTDGTRHLAEEAVKSGIKRVLFVSTVKVNGEESEASYTEESPPRPTDPYGTSKWEAELALRRIEATGDLQVVVVRPTLVYGPGVKGNFLNMLKAVQREAILPLASIDNRRSLIYVGNLVDALVTCTVHPDAAGKTYFVSDGGDVSTPELIRNIASSLGVSTHLLPFPPGLIRMGGRLFGKSETVNRVIGSLTVDSGKIRRELGWTPPFTMAQGLRETAAWFLES